jgi:group I intron endonuclease
MTKKNYYLKRTAGIYCITHTATGRQYVGQSNDCFERFKQHSTPKKNSTGIKGALMKYGVDAFSFVILEECSKEEQNERETWWIAELGTLSPGGFNLTGGGGAATVVSAETRVKISAAQKGKTHSPEHCEKIGAAHKGMTRSPEACAKMSAAAKGKTISPETKAKMSTAIKGKTHSSEACAKISAAFKGKTRSPEDCAKMSEGRLRANAARKAASYTEPLQEALQSLRTDKTWTPMADDSTPPAGPPSVAPPTLEELEFLCGLL